MADKLKMETKDLAEENYRKLIELFPNIVTETTDENGNVVRAIDADLLQQEINGKVLSDEKERYRLTWPDKAKHIVLGNQKTTNTLRLDREKSVGRDGIAGSIDTGNIYIEGDNLEALKLLRETYLGKIQVIYIDPPYNTGNDGFVYDDDSSISEEEFEDRGGARDEEGNLLYDFKVNNESNGRFHTDWLNMIYPRLSLSRDLLCDDGVIFISIDDNEQENLKKVCDEIFGSQNFLAQIIWERAYSPVNLKKHFSRSHDYILCYAKNMPDAVCNGLPRNDTVDSRYINPDNDLRGPWKPSDLSVGPVVANKVYPITTPSGRVVLPPEGRCWSLSKDAFNERLQDNRIWFGPDGNNVPSIKRFRSELLKSGVTPMTIWKYQEVGHSQDAAQKLKELFDGKALFEYPKPIGLIKRCVELYSKKDSLILDFFSGSATTAQAVMQLNAEDGGHRKFILVQLPEECGEGTEAYKAGYKNICEIGEERIRRAGKKIKEESPLATGDLDIGFRVYRVDDSNMENVFYKPSETTQDMLETLAGNIKEDRTGEDLLVQIMLELGVDLSSKIEETKMSGKKVFSISDGYMTACFDNDVTDDVITQIAKTEPYYAVFRDSGMASDSVMTNYEQIFKTYSPKTIVKVL